MLNKNYHSKYILYPAVKEHQIIQYLKDHKLKNLINTIITVIKPLENTLLKLYLKKGKLIIQIMFSTSITPEILEDTINIINRITQDYNNVLTIRKNRINENRLNIIRGFN